MAYQGYGGYGGYNQAPVSSDAQNLFQSVDKDRSGRINAQELKACLVNGKGENFSDTACNLMIGMFDSGSGTVDVYGFERLYNYVNQWLGVFKGYDTDQSGSIQENELTNALTQMGFRFSPEFIRYLVTKSDPSQKQEISVDQFIVLCIQIQKFTEAFRVRDAEQTGMITIGFEDFLTVALSCSS